MCKEKIISKLKQKCDELLEEFTSKNDDKKIKIYSSIKQILDTENAFEKLDAEVAVNLIYDLVQNKTKAKSIYIKLLSSQN